MRPRLLPVLFFCLSAAALAVALVRRDDVPEPRWEGYPGTEPDWFDVLGPGNALVWLGAAIGFAVAGLVLLLVRDNGPPAPAGSRSEPRPTP